ncbi:MAG: cellulase family glycosylhydrolase [Melioribacter sp.]|nr:cellulase family glycosylhydrolase [Melioribacter sp.]
MRKPYLFFFFLALVIFEGCSSILVEEKKEFIKVRGTHFELAGKPYYFVGANFWYGCYIGSPGKTGDRARLIRELNLLKEYGITNLRVLAASEKSYIKASIDPAIQPEPGVYDEELLEGLDFLLYEMKKRNMHAVIFLNNYWEWSGGFVVYNKWFGSGKEIDPHTTYTWPEFMNYSAEFYRNEEGNKHFREFIKKIITRRNKFTNQYYFEDPTIMAWQLANEPRPGWGEDALPYLEYFYKWIDETAAYIRSLDPNHLVTTGNEGLRGSLDLEEVYLKAHQSKNIDYITFHLWPKNWSWFDGKRIEETLPSTIQKAIDYINKHIVYARQLNKPITLEEFGLSRDNENCLAGTSTTARDKYYKIVFDLVYDSAAAGAPIAGTNFWSWGGTARGKNKDNIWRPGDPFVGDPPQEPQGFNSVFDTDLSTLSIIKEHSIKISSLRNRKLNTANRIEK